MVTINPEYLYNDSDMTLRDARHAHNFYTQHGHAFSPKVKFLYHVVFALRGLNVNSRAPNTAANLKQIAVMAKTVDLPSFRASVDVKQQYNRKKNVQTRIDYDEISMRFHDDNTGLTRAMLEEYYRFYFKDGNKNDGRGFPLGFNPRDKYQALTDSYGMDNELSVPFFYYIKIFQLAKQQWYSYTLINPILTSWSHDTLDYSDGSTPMENTINVSYEGVLYNNGTIADNADPAGFTDQETGYDVIPSPLKIPANAFSGSSISSNKLAPTLKNQNTNVSGVDRLFAATKNASQPLNLLSLITNTRDSAGNTQIAVPLTNTQETATLSSLSKQQVRTRDGATIQNYLQKPENRSALVSTTRKVLASGYYSSDWNASNFNNFDTLSSGAQNAIINDVLDRAGNDSRIQQVASVIINKR